jgi:hypothetical protein
MVDDQAVLAFLQHLNLVLSEALRGRRPAAAASAHDDPRLGDGPLADAQGLDQALRQAAARLAELDS